MCVVRGSRDEWGVVGSNKGSARHGVLRGGSVVDGIQEGTTVSTLTESPSVPATTPRCSFERIVTEFNAGRSWIHDDM